ncbi:hypothetical protein RB600_006224 [Gaeumannomyces tritici]
MANRLLAERDAGAVGKCWVERFVKRRAELGTRWIRKYDYQRAKCEDPKLVSAWFDLVRNTVAKYGILDDDIYNFDETGFLMGMIAAVIVITTSEGRGKAKLVQPGNREWRRRRRSIFNVVKSGSTSPCLPRGIRRASAT